MAECVTKGGKNNCWRSGKETAGPFHLRRLRNKLSFVITRGDAARIFVETGTYFGDTTYAMRDMFDRLYTIELSEALYRNAIKRFAKFPQITPVQGDSAEKLSDILTQVRQPCLFWLDGHYSGGITAQGKLNTPVFQELNHIFDHPIKTHFLLIDDAREFVGRYDYPTIEELRSFCLTHRPDWKFAIDQDIIRFHPNLPA